MSSNPQATVPRKAVRASTLGATATFYSHIPRAAQPLSTIIQTPTVNPNTTTPPKHTHRTLILAFDGTANIFDETNTNVVKLFSMLRKDLPEQQLVYYQTGCGTYNANPGVWTPLMVKLSKVADLATAAYIDAHICAGYKFLVDQYRIGDKICLFGFSRGAYTARCLAGMLHKVGLLTQGNHEQIPFAYEVYRDTSPLSNFRSEGFKKTFSRLINIEFLGVWDTVSSVGILYGRHLPFTSSNSIVKTFRHALALDERRAKFKANVWHRSVKADVTSKRRSTGDPEHGTEVQHDPDASAKMEEAQKARILGYVHDDRPVGAGDQTNAKGRAQVEEPAPMQETAAVADSNREDSPLVDIPPSLLSRESIRRLLSRKKKSTMDSDALMRAQGDLPDGGSPVYVCEDCDDGTHRDTNVLEVWFAGCHSDVGGGSVPDWTTNSLAGPSLRWMIREIIDSHAGVHFDEAELVKLGIDPTPGAPRADFKPALMSEKKQAKPDGRQTSTLDYSTGTALKPDDAESVSTNSHHSLARIQTTTPKEQKERARDYLDAVSPMHDQLKEVRAWWLLEVMPILWYFQDKEGKWHRRWRPNLSKARVINNTAPVNLHVSVRRRMEAGIGYKPKAEYSGQPKWVE